MYFYYFILIFNFISCSPLLNFSLPSFYIILFSFSHSFIRFLIPSVPLSSLSPSLLAFLSSWPSIHHHSSFTHSHTFNNTPVLYLSIHHVVSLLTHSLTCLFTFTLIIITSPLGVPGAGFGGVLPGALHGEASVPGVQGVLMGQVDRQKDRQIDG